MPNPGMSTSDLEFTPEELAVDEALGYPRAFAKLSDRSSRCCGGGTGDPLPYEDGPPFTFLPYSLQPRQALQVKDLNDLFPIVDPTAVAFASADAQAFVDLLWNQLHHLGNAGFDLELFRVDPYGNVLYRHAGSSSPLAWVVDHWFPVARGGKTTPSNLRIVQIHACRRKQSKLEFLVPWWELQVGVGINLFLSIFASSDADYRNRAFSFLFGNAEEQSTLKDIRKHTFPHQFTKMSRKVGLAVAAMEPSACDSAATLLRPLDMNRSPQRRHTPNRAPGKFSADENHGAGSTHSKNPHVVIAAARDSLRQSVETKRKQAELSNLDKELGELKSRNEDEQRAIQGMEALLIQKRQRVDKCRRLAESQSSYKAVLEKMIRDTMHQIVVYKEQLRLNEAATSALMARLEAQRAICDSSEIDLRRKLHKRNEIGEQVKPYWRQTRRRSRIDKDLIENEYDERVKMLLARSASNHARKELRKFLEEELRASAELKRFAEDDESDGVTSPTDAKNNGSRTIFFPRNIPSMARSSSFREQAYRHKARQGGDQGEIAKRNSTSSVTEKLRRPTIFDGSCERRGGNSMKFTDPVTDKNKAQRESDVQRVLRTRENATAPSSPGRPDDEDDCDRYLRRVGKGNLDKWVQVLMGSSQEGPSVLSSPTGSEIHPAELSNDDGEDHGDEAKLPEANRLPQHLEGGNKGGNDHGKSPSSNRVLRGFRSLPSSPSMILGMKRGVGRRLDAAGNLENKREPSSAAGSSNSKLVKKFTEAIKKVVVNK